MGSSFKDPVLGNAWITDAVLKDIFDCLKQEIWKIKDQCTSGCLKKEKAKIAKIPSVTIAYQFQDRAYQSHSIMKWGPGKDRLIFLSILPVKLVIHAINQSEMVISGRSALPVISEYFEGGTETEQSNENSRKKAQLKAFACKREKVLAKKKKVKRSKVTDNTSNHKHKARENKLNLFDTKSSSRGDVSKDYNTEIYRDTTTCDRESNSDQFQPNFNSRRQECSQEAEQLQESIGVSGGNSGTFYKKQEVHRCEQFMYSQQEIEQVLETSYNDCLFEETKCQNEELNIDLVLKEAHSVTNTDCRLGLNISANLSGFSKTLVAKDTCVAKGDLVAKDSCVGADLKNSYDAGSLLTASCDNSPGNNFINTRSNIRESEIKVKATESASQPASERFDLRISVSGVTESSDSRFEDTDMDLPVITKTSRNRQKAGHKKQDKISKYIKVRKSHSHSNNKQSAIPIGNSKVGLEGNVSRKPLPKLRSVNIGKRKCQTNENFESSSCSDSDTALGVSPLKMTKLDSSHDEESIGQEDCNDGGVVLQQMEINETGGDRRDSGDRIMEDKTNLEMRLTRWVGGLAEFDLRSLLDKNMTFLKRIFHGKVMCSRHEAYKKGGNMRNNLTYQVRLGIYSEEQVDVIMRTLMSVFCKQHTKYLDYVTKVLLPEAAVRIVMEFGTITHDEAEHMLRSCGDKHLTQ